MSHIVRFENVAKKFTMHHQRSRSLQEVAMNLISRSNQSDHEEFWSLRDANFEIAAGETVALLGPNGAGKSTAMKLIARILTPTSGRIEISGRVGALLELGSGFHPDMTGRENIYLNGSILGLSQAEIRQKIDQIIDFAELDRFIDLPVKHYSSGMYVRLGFAVAVHTDPDILLVDEVLAVGDAAFQRKCMDHIGQLRQKGVTILLVTHSLEAIQNLCQRAIWLDEGRVIADGATETTINQYLWQSHKDNSALVFENENSRWGSKLVTIREVLLLDKAGNQQGTFNTNDQITLRMHYHASQYVEQPVFGFAIHDGNGIHITGPNTRYNNFSIPFIEGEGVVDYTIPRCFLLEGTYFISVTVCNWDMDMSQVFDYHDKLYPFQVYSKIQEERFGLITFNGNWNHTPMKDAKSMSSNLEKRITSEAS